MKKRKKHLKKAVLSVTAATMMLGSSLSVSAAGLGDVFDAGYYADTYADLKAAFGDDADALLQHYLTYGASEGRAGRADFNVSQYRSAYADLDAAFGDDWNAYAEHYLTYGIEEGRTGVTSSAGTPDAGAGQETQTPEQTQTGTTPAAGTGDTPVPVGNNPVREFWGFTEPTYWDREQWSFADSTTVVSLDIPQDAAAVTEKDAYGVTYRCYSSPELRANAVYYPNLAAKGYTGGENRTVMSRVAEYAAANEKFAALLTAYGNRIVFVDGSYVEVEDDYWLGGVWHRDTMDDDWTRSYWVCGDVDCNPADCLYVFVDTEEMDNNAPEQWTQLFNAMADRQFE